jgi:propionyl-CoA synthetase
MIPEAVFAMLACTRLGLIHSVVFAGFASASVATRIDDAEAKLVITADAGLRGGRLIPLKKLVDAAIAMAAFKPAHVLVCNRRIDVNMPTQPGRDLDYAELRKSHLHEEVSPVWLESGETSYLLYTSGTTAKPKGIPRDTGGYAVAMAASMRYVFAGEPVKRSSRPPISDGRLDILTGSMALLLRAFKRSFMKGFRFGPTQVSGGRLSRNTVRPSCLPLPPQYGF